MGDKPKLTQNVRIMKAHEDCLSWLVLKEKLNTLKLEANLNDVLTIKSMCQQLARLQTRLRRRKLDSPGAAEWGGSGGLQS